MIHCIFTQVLAKTLRLCQTNCPKYIHGDFFFWGTVRYTDSEKRQIIYLSLVSHKWSNNEFYHQTINEWISSYNTRVTTTRPHSDTIYSKNQSQYCQSDRPRCEPITTCLISGLITENTGPVLVYYYIIMLAQTCWFCNGSILFLFLCVQILVCYFALSFHPIDFTPWHNDPYVLRCYAMTFLRIPSCSSGFIQDFLDHYID